jgi:hypothetical protein
MSPEDYYTYGFRPEHSFYTMEEIPISPAPAPAPAPVPAPRAQPQPQPGTDADGPVVNLDDPRRGAQPQLDADLDGPGINLDDFLRGARGEVTPLPIDLVDPDTGFGDATMQVIVYGPDGTAYPNPLAALRAGVTNYTTTPPPGSGFANGGRVFAPAPAGALVRAARAVPAPGRNPLALAALGRRGGYR